MLDKAHIRIINIDAVICCEKPKILPFRGQIIAKLAETLGIDKGRISLKGKTGEGLGPVGLGQAVETEAIALVQWGRADEF
jgi:2-C-methyl-D-erythritol 2,4-cyclodiphosphate synthase